MLPHLLAVPLAKVRAISANVEGMRPVRDLELSLVPKAEHAVVVFGTGDPGEMRARVATAAEALRADPRAIAILSGAPVTRGESEAQRSRRELVEAHGIAPERLLTESAAESTTQNAKFVAQMLAQAGVARTTLVTSAYHMARAKGFMKRAMRETGQQDVSLETARAHPPLAARDRARIAARETASRVAGHLLWDRFDR